MYYEKMVPCKPLHPESPEFFLPSAYRLESQFFHGPCQSECRIRLRTVNAGIHTIYGYGVCLTFLHAKCAWQAQKRHTRRETWNSLTTGGFLTHLLRSFYAFSVYFEILWNVLFHN
jgi:hypothetical protein